MECQVNIEEDQYSVHGRGKIFFIYVLYKFKTNPCVNIFFYRNRVGISFLELKGNCSATYKICVSRLASQKRIVRDRKKAVNRHQLNIKKTEEKIQKIEDEMAEIHERMNQK
jgi:hypothetical protein